MISQDASDEMEVDTLPRPAMFPAKFPGTPLYKLSIGSASSHIPMLHTIYVSEGFELHY
jgi:hypothetical protein